MQYQLDHETTINILTPSLPQSLKAFKNRGGKDRRGNHDSEDIIHMLEYREEIRRKLLKTEDGQKAYAEKDSNQISAILMKRSGLTVMLIFHHPSILTQRSKVQLEIFADWKIQCLA